MTPVVLQRRRHRLALKKKRLAKRKASEAEYAKLLAQRKKESKVYAVFINIPMCYDKNIKMIYVFR